MTWKSRKIAKAIDDYLPNYRGSNVDEANEGLHRMVMSGLRDGYSLRVSVYTAAALLFYGGSVLAESHGMYSASECSKIGIAVFGVCSGRNIIEWLSIEIFKRKLLDDVRPRVHEHLTAMLTDPDYAKEVYKIADKNGTKTTP